MMVAHGRSNKEKNSHLVPENMVINQRWSLVRGSLKKVLLYVNRSIIEMNYFIEEKKFCQ